MKKQYIMYAVLGFCFILVIVPVVYLFSNSLKSNVQISTQLLRIIPHPLHFENYAVAWQGIARPLWNTIIVAISSLLGLLLFASLASFAIAFYTFRGKELFYFLIISLLLIPQMAILIPLFLVTRELHLLNTLWALILVYIAGGQSFNILLMRSFFEEIPHGFIDSARMDGAGDLRIYLSIILPLSLPIISVLAISHVLFVFNDFIWPYITVQQEPVRTVAVALVYFVTGSNTVERGQVFAASVIACVPLIVLFSFTMRSFIAGLTSAGIKG